jgi:hypothetical protein
VLAAHKTTDRYVEPPRTSAPRKWEVGQWVLYRLSTAGRLGYIKHAVVGESRCGWWFESVVVLSDYEDRTAFKVCLHDTPDLRDDLAKQDLLERYLWRRNERTIVKDLRDRKNDKAVDEVLRMLDGFAILAQRGATEEGRSEVVVGGGQFAGVVRVPARMYLDGAARPVTLWFHPEVPLGGVIKAAAYDDNDEMIMQLELLDYGLTGAKTELPDFDEYKRTVGLD